MYGYGYYNPFANPYARRFAVGGYEQQPPVPQGGQPGPGAPQGPVDPGAQQAGFQQRQVPQGVDMTKAAVSNGEVVRKNGNLEIVKKGKGEKADDVLMSTSGDFAVLGNTVDPEYGVPYKTIGKALKKAYDKSYIHGDSVSDKTQEMNNDNMNQMVNGLLQRQQAVNDYMGNTQDYQNTDNTVYKQAYGGTVCRYGNGGTVPAYGWGSELAETAGYGTTALMGLGATGATGYAGIKELMKKRPNYGKALMAGGGVLLGAGSTLAAGNEFRKALKRTIKKYNKEKAKEDQIMSALKKHQESGHDLNGYNSGPNAEFGGNTLPSNGITDDYLNSVPAVNPQANPEYYAYLNTPGVQTNAFNQAHDNDYFANANGGTVSRPQFRSNYLPSYSNGGYVPSYNIGSSAIGGAMGGAELGTTIAPGIGTAVGAGLGALAGGIGGYFEANAAKKKQQELEAMLAGMRPEFTNIDPYFNEALSGIRNSGIPDDILRLTSQQGIAQAMRNASGVGSQGGRAMAIEDALQSQMAQEEQEQLALAKMRMEQEKDAASILSNQANAHLTQDSQENDWLKTMMAAKISNLEKSLYADTDRTGSLIASLGDSQNFKDSIVEGKEALKNRKNRKNLVGQPTGPVGA